MQDHGHPRAERQKALQVDDLQGFYDWWLFTDSNRGPVDYDSIALTD